MLLLRLQALLAALWGGLLLCVALVAAPSAFAVLERAQAGLVVAHLFAIEAQLSLVAALVLMLIERRLTRDAEAARPVMSLALLLPALAMFCTVAGYYALQPLMAEARLGAGVASFATLHGASLGLFAIKGIAVLVLAWRLSRSSTS